MDTYRKTLADLDRTWLEWRHCRFHARRRRHDRTATKLARAAQRRQTRREIEVEL